MSEQSELCAALNRLAAAIEAQAKAQTAMAEAVMAQALAIGELLDSDGDAPDALAAKPYLSGKPR